MKDNRHPSVMLGRAMLMPLAITALIALAVKAENEPIAAGFEEGVPPAESESEKAVEEVYDLLRNLPKYKAEILKEAIDGSNGSEVAVDKRSCKGWLGKCRRQDHLCCNQRCRCGFRNQYCCL